jgi:hypothetical protein
MKQRPHLTSYLPTQQVCSAFSGIHWTILLASLKCGCSNLAPLASGTSSVERFGSTRIEAFAKTIFTP